MKNIIIATILLIAISSNLHAQGTNNDFDFDEIDFEVLFAKLGYNVFKFPVQQSKNQLFDIVIEEYRDGELESRQTVLEITNEAFGGWDLSAYLKPRMSESRTDSVYFHRFYVEQNDSLLTITTKTHGLNTPIKFDVKGLGTANVRARFETKEELAKNGVLKVEDEKLLLFYYANKSDEEMLSCPAGMSKEQLIKAFHYTVFVHIIPIESK